MDNLKAATTVQAMVVDTTSDRVLVPTLRQVQDLLASLEPRCVRSTFTNEVFGWHSLLKEAAGSIKASIPDLAGIQSLIDAFRRLRRLGNESVNGVTIETRPSAVAWTIALTKWCLGYPPLVITSSGTTLLQQDSCDVSLVLVGGSPSGRNFDFQVKVHSHMRDPSSLVKCGLDSSVVGMVDISSMPRDLWTRPISSQAGRDHGV